MVVLAAAVLAGASFSQVPAPKAEAAVPDHVMLAVQEQVQNQRAQAWFDASALRVATNARVAEEVRLAEEARVAEEARQAEAARAEAARQAEEARAAAAAEATRNALRDPRGVARVLVAERGWGAGQFSCLDSLWTKESGWKVSADNPSSSAYGIPQALPGSKMASVGADWATNPVTQITWGLNYIESRYGSPCSAWAHSRSSNWY